MNEGKMMRKLFSRLVFLTALWGLLCGASRAQSPKIEVGEPFPGLILPRLQDGKPASVADFRGQKLVLHVWASW